MFAGERRRRHYHRTRAALAELGGAEACLHQEGLGSKFVAGDEVTSTCERARRAGSASSTPLARLLMRPPTRRCVWRSPAGRGGRRERFLPSKKLQTRAIVLPVSLPQVIRGCRSCIFFFGVAIGMVLRSRHPCSTDLSRMQGDPVPLASQRGDHACIHLLGLRYSVSAK